MMRPAITVVGLAALWTGIPALTANPDAQSAAPASSAGAQVTGSRSFSPMVEDLAAAAAFYTHVGLDVPAAPEAGYAWSGESWHLDLHGAQAPGSPMRFIYVRVPGAVPPAMPLLIEPVEHRDVEHRSQEQRPQDPGVTTLVLLVRDLDAAAARLPAGVRMPVRRVTAYGGHARAMTVYVPGAHPMELLQLDPLPDTTAPPGQNAIGAWVRVAVHDLDRTLALYRDRFGLAFRVTTPTDAELGGLIGSRDARLRLATATLPGTGTRLEFLETTGVPRRPFTPRIQDPGAARLQLTVNNLETALEALRDAGPSTVVSTGGRIIVQPQYRVAVVSDLNGFYLVLTDRGPGRGAGAKP